MPPSSLAFDYHSHHSRCGHAVGELRDYIQRASELGITHFGVSDHGPAYWLPGDHAQPGIQMASSELPRYVREASEEKAKYADRLSVAVGVEADFIEGHEAALATWLEAHPFDYVLGSVHYVERVSVFDRGRWFREDPETVFRKYYELVIQAAGSGLFDILSHLSVIEVYAPPVPESLASELYPEVAAAIAAAGCIVEINTSCYRKQPDWDEPFPNRRLLRELLRVGVPLTFGSDCHKPDEVGFGHDKVTVLLKELGVTGPAQHKTVLRNPILALGG